MSLSSRMAQWMFIASKCCYFCNIPGNWQIPIHHLLVVWIWHWKWWIIKLGSIFSCPSSPVATRSKREVVCHKKNKCPMHIDVWDTVKGTWDLAEFEDWSYKIALLCVQNICMNYVLATQQFCLQAELLLPWRGAETTELVTSND